MTKSLETEKEKFHLPDFTMSFPVSQSHGFNMNLREWKKLESISLIQTKGTSVIYMKKLEEELHPKCVTLY